MEPSLSCHLPSDLSLERILPSKDQPAFRGNFAVALTTLVLESAS